MTQKITLSIPDLLHEKLEAWRASFNLSKMFQEALTEAIQKKEAFQKRFSDDFDMSEIVSRLKQEKTIWEKKFYSLGKAEGLRWAKIAHYSELLYVLTFTDAYKLISDPNMNTYFDQIYQTMGLSAYSNSGSVDHEQQFMEGWVNGVKGFWNQIKEKVQS